MNDIQIKKGRLVHISERKGEGHQLHRITHPEIFVYLTLSLAKDYRLDRMQCPWLYHIQVIALHIGHAIGQHSLTSLKEDKLTFPLYIYQKCEQGRLFVNHFGIWNDVMLHPNTEYRFTAHKG